MPTLHLILGIANYLYKKMVEEAQADCEGYYLDYVGVERIWELSTYYAVTEKTNKNTFQATNGKYERQLRRDLRGEEDEEQQNLMELGVLVTTQGITFTSLLCFLHHIYVQVIDNPKHQVQGWHDIVINIHDIKQCF